jgi:hypothetical protein
MSKSKSAAKSAPAKSAPAAPKRRMNVKPAAKSAPAAPAAEPTGPTPEEQAKAAAFFDANAKAGAKGSKAAPKVKGEAKPKEAKPQKVVVAFAPRVAAKGSTVHAIELTARPTSGSRLFAHTHAALTMFGMLSDTRPAVPEKQVLAILGQRAVAYHKQQQNFEAVQDHGLRLTAPGLNFFKARMADGKVDGGLANDFLSVFLDGKAPSSTGVNDGKVYVALKL